MPVKLEIRIQ